MNRRQFLATMGSAGALATVPGGLRAAEENGDPPPREFLGLLIDTTLCVGCKQCEAACAVSHGLPIPEASRGDREDSRRPPEQLTEVLTFETKDGPVHVKRQCMHCNQPACASACLTKAMLKTRDGPVIWREGKCMGCRFCMVSCPFDAPRAQYDEAVPDIMKCDLCWERLGRGEQPACVEACPAGALLFGTRREVLQVAQSRIRENPDKYVDHIYGEREAGGTGVLYLASTPFDQLGFRANVELESYPAKTKGYFFGIMAVDFLWPVVMLGLYRLFNGPPEGDV